MDQNDVITSFFMLKLTNGFQERLAFDITDSSAHFNDRDFCIFIMSQIQIRFGSVIGYKYFSVLYRIHGSGINIDVRVEFLHGHRISAGFQKPAE